MSKEQPWCKSVEKHLTKRYPTASVEDPRPINVHLRTGIDVRIESSWYDVLVLEEPCSKRVLDGNTTGVHCFEVKYSGKGKRGSFGAFTIGEWLAAKLACNEAKYTYEILYVWKPRNRRSQKVESIPVTKRLLRDLLRDPQLKLYFSEAFIMNHLAGHRERGSSRERYVTPLKKAVMEALEDAVNRLLGQSNQSHRQFSGEVAHH